MYNKIKQNIDSLVPKCGQLALAHLALPDLIEDPGNPSFQQPPPTHWSTSQNTLKFGVICLLTRAWATEQTRIIPTSKEGPVSN